MPTNEASPGLKQAAVRRGIRRTIREWAFTAATLFRFAKRCEGETCARSDPPMGLQLTKDAIVGCVQLLKRDSIYDPVT
jgi:hypothetical protein